MLTNCSQTSAELTRASVSAAQRKFYKTALRSETVHACASYTYKLLKLSYLTLHSEVGGN